LLARASALPAIHRANQIDRSVTHVEIRREICQCTTARSIFLIDLALPQGLDLAAAEYWLPYAYPKE
jgi:hypothetical protein